MLHNRLKVFISLKDFFIFCFLLLTFSYLFLNSRYLFPDGQGYFSYLPTIFFDKNLDLSNEFLDMKIPIPLAITSKGYISNIWSLGSAFFWTPFYLIGKILSPSNISPIDSWFWIWVNFGTIFYGIITVFLIREILKILGRNKELWLIISIAFLGTPAFFYFFIIPGTSHGITAFIVSVLIWYWLISINYNSYIRYIIIGIFSGMATMVRPQEAIFAFIPICEICINFIYSQKSMIESIKIFLIFLIGFLFGFLPQLLLWKFIYGSFFAAPAKFNLSLQYFNLKNILFSSFHGLLIWTPLYGLAILGLLFGVFKKTRIFLGFFISMIGQIFINACCLAFWEGYSFGLRQMTSCLPIVAIGISELYSFLNQDLKIPLKFIRIIILIPGLWTLGLLLNYYCGLDLLGYIPMYELKRLQFEIWTRLPSVYHIFFSEKKISLSILVITMFWGIIYCLILNAIFSLLKNRKNLSIFIISLTVLTFSYTIIKAHLNKPVKPIDKIDFVTEKKLEDFFKNQVKDIRKKYFLDL